MGHISLDFICWVDLGQQNWNITNIFSGACGGPHSRSCTGNQCPADDWFGQSIWYNNFCHRNTLTIGYYNFACNNIICDIIWESWALCYHKRYNMIFFSKYLSSMIRYQELIVFCHNIGWDQYKQSFLLILLYYLNRMVFRFDISWHICRLVFA